MKGVEKDVMNMKEVFTKDNLTTNIATHIRYGFCTIFFLSVLNKRKLMDSCIKWSVEGTWIAGNENLTPS